MGTVLIFCSIRLPDVAEGPDHADLAAIHNSATVYFDVKDRAVFASAAKIVVNPLYFAFDATAYVLLDNVAVIGMGQIQRTEPFDDFLDFVAEHLRHDRIYVAKDAVLDKINAGERGFGK